MPTGTLQVIASIGGVSIQGTMTETGDGQVAWDPTLAVGKASTAWTKTDANTGAATLAEGHGITSGQVTVFWAAGVRYGVAATVDGNSVACEGGAGDDFPANSTVVTITPEVSQLVGFDGDAMLMLGIVCEVRALVQFCSGAGAVLYAVELAAGVPVTWDSSSGVTTPITGDAVESIRAASGDTADTGLLTVGVLYN